MIFSWYSMTLRSFGKSKTSNWTTRAATTKPEVEKNLKQLAGARRHLFELKKPLELRNPRRGAEIFDPATATWAATGNLLAGRYQHSSAVLPDGRVLVAGGLDKRNFEIGSAELYTP